MLIESFKHIYNNMARTDANIERLKRNTIHGNEMTKNARITKMNMILMGDGHNNINKQDSLKNIIKNKYDIVITNMPFAQTTDYGDLYDIPTQDANSVCLQHCIQAINDKSENGRIAIIVGDGILENDHYESLRKYIFNRCNLQSIVALPEGVFAPYSKTTKTNILLLTDIKKKEKQEHYWYFSVQHDGYSFTDNRKKIKNGKNDLETFIIHRNDHANILFKKVDLTDIESKKYKLIPFIGEKLNNKHATKLKEICFEQNILVGKDYSKYQTVTLSSRAREQRGIVSKESYYRANPLVSKDRSKYKILYPNQFAYRPPGLDIGTIGYNGYNYPVLVTPYYCVFSIDLELAKPQYLFNIFRSKQFLDKVLKLKRGTARPGIKI